VKRGRGNPIPLASRIVVEHRDNRHCVRCGGIGGPWHHRRRRDVRDEHQHCACNGIILCKTCHAFVHSHPETAREQGWIVSAHVGQPFSVPVWTARYGWVTHDCEGRRKPWPG
jgi:hypothetical protein